MSNPVLYETHAHTPLCKHAQGQPEEYALAAIGRCLKGIVFTCHNPMPECWSQGVRMFPEQLPEYVALISRAKRAMKGRTDVRLGLECDFAPGFESWLERQIASVPLEFVLGSVHPHMSYYRKAYFTSGIVEYQRDYFDFLARAAESRLFDALTHPDLVKNISPSEWNIGRIMDSILSCLDRIARTGIAMELNTSGLQKDIQEMNPGPAILRAMRERDIPVTIGADAHTPQRVGAHFEVALDSLVAAGYSRVSYFLERKRCDVSIAEARASLSEVADRTVV
jgi:histidinol-phosphatase (PHP family)